MHLYLWVSLAGSCLLHPALSLIGGEDRAGSQQHGTQRHHGACGSGIRDRRRTTLATPVAAFAAPLLLARHGRAGKSRSSSATTSAANTLRRQGLSGPAKASVSGVVRRHHHQQQQQVAVNGNMMRQQQHHLAAPTTAARLRSRQPSPPPPLLAARANPIDSDEDFYSDRGSVEPPAMAQRSGRSPVRRVNNNNAGRGSGRPGSGGGRGVSVREASGGSGSNVAVDSAAPGGGGRGGGRGQGLDQSDPLIRDWQSAQVLAGKGGRGAGGGRGERRYVQDSAGRGGGGGGRSRGEGRGGGRGRGRGRGRGHNKTPVEIYVGSDTIPWYIKEVQDKGLDTQGEFSRWWQSNVDPKANAASVKGMKVDELKAQLERMELPTTGRKAELAQRLTDAYLRCSLSDDNFRHAQVTDVSANDEDLPNCFPQVYEKATEAELEKLWRESRKGDHKRTQNNSRP